MQKFFTLTVNTAIATAAMLATSVTAQERIAFGSTAQSSVHYTYAVSAAKAINDNSDLDVTVIATGGAVDNIARIARGQIDLGLGTYATIYQAYKGIGKFEGQGVSGLRGLWVHAPSTQAWVVREDSDVTKLSELNGKPFTPGQRGSATEQLAIQMLEVLGVEPDLQRLTLGDAVDAVKDGRSIGYVKAGGSGTIDGTTMELMAFTPITMLSFTNDEKTKVQEAFPFISFASYEDGEVEGFPAFTVPVQVIGEFTTSDALTEEQVMTLLEAIVDNTEVQANAFPSFADIDVLQDSVDLINIPLHAGAVKFYQSRGIEVPDELIPPEMK